MKSRRRNRSAQPSRWAWCNSPAGLRHRRACADAAREARSADRPPVYAGPEPLSHWQTVQALAYILSDGDFLDPDSVESTKQLIAAIRARLGEVK